MIPQLQNHGIETDVIYPSGDGQLIIHNTDGTDIVINGSTVLKKSHYINNLFSIIKTLFLYKDRYKIILFVGPNQDTLYAAIMAKLFLRIRIAYRITMLGEDDPLAIRAQGRFGWLRAYLLYRVDAIVCLNPAMEVASQHAKIPQERIFLIPQVTDIDLFSPVNQASRDKIREEEGLSLNVKIVIFCGVLVERKGVDLLLKAWSEVIVSHPASLLLLVGPDGEIESDAQFSKTVKLSAQDPAYGDSIRFCGYRQDVHRLLQVSDVFVLPSRQEGTPNALIEAMAAGLPSVISDLAGVSGAVVRDGIEAFVVRQNDWRQLKDCICRLLDDDDLAKSFGGLARNRAVANYSLDSSAEKYASLFQKLESKRF